MPSIEVHILIGRVIRKTVCLSFGFGIIYYNIRQQDLFEYGTALKDMNDVRRAVVQVATQIFLLIA